MKRTHRIPCIPCPAMTVVRVILRAPDRARAGHLACFFLHRPNPSAPGFSSCILQRRTLPEQDPPSLCRDLTSHAMSYSTAQRHGRFLRAARGGRCIITLREGAVVLLLYYYTAVTRDAMIARNTCTAHSLRVEKDAVALYHGRQIRLILALHCGSRPNSPSYWGISYELLCVRMG